MLAESERQRCADSLCLTYPVGRTGPAEQLPTVGLCAYGGMCLKQVMLVEEPMHWKMGKAVLSRESLNMKRETLSRGVSIYKKVSVSGK